MADIGQALLSGYQNAGSAAANEFSTMANAAPGLASLENQANFNIAQNTAKQAYGSYNTIMDPAVAQSQGLLASNDQNAQAVNDLSNLLGLGPQGTAGAMAALQQTPGYQFQVDTGTTALQQKLNAGGLAFSGNFAQGASDYLSGVASNTYNQQLTNYENFINQQSTLGQTSAGLLQNKADLNTALTLQTGSAAAAGTRGNLASGVGQGVSTHGALLG